MQPMTVALLEQLVLAKPYFDRDGLIVALDEDRVVGFVHAGFGPRDDGLELSTELGVTCMLMVRPEYRRLRIGSQLLERSEAYLRGRGAKVLYAGGIRPLDPFYLGLYGGSELPGVVDSDTEAQQLYRSAGYAEIDRVIIFHRDLRTFRPPIGRQQLLNRRRTKLEVRIDPKSQTWWEACTMGGFDRARYELLDCQTAQPLASAMVWSMEPLSTSWGVRAVGLIDFEVDERHRRQGLATYLLSEAFRLLQHEGVQVVEAQTMQQNSVALHLYENLGFLEIDRGTVFRKAQ